MQAIFYPADEHYKTQTNGTPGYEASAQVAATARRLVNLYVFNKSGSPVFLKVQDSANGGTDNGPATVYPIGATSFISIVANEKMFNGIFLKGYTDDACSNAAGSVLHFKVDYMAAV